MTWDALRDGMGDTGQHPLYRSHESRRAYPRVRLRMPVRIGLSGGRVVCADIYNMSPDGIQVRCDRHTALGIHPDARPVAPGAGPTVLVALRLRSGRDVHTIVVHCRLGYLLPQGPDEVILGLQFQELLPAQREAIDAVLAASLEPADR